MESFWEIEGVTVRLDRMHRLYRSGICPVLEVTVTYPVLEPLGREPSPAVTRFNEAYRALAEGWMAWGEGILAVRAKQAFSEGGAGAAYRFERWRATCHMTVSLPDEGDRSLTVTRTVRLCGGGIPPVEALAADNWRGADLSFSRHR